MCILNSCCCCTPPRCKSKKGTFKNTNSCWCCIRKESKSIFWWWVYLLFKSALCLGIIGQQRGAGRRQARNFCASGLKLSLFYHLGFSGFFTPWFGDVTKPSKTFCFFPIVIWFQTINCQCTTSGFLLTKSTIEVRHLKFSLDSL